MCEVVNGIFYILRAGCLWRMIPHVSAAWQSVPSGTIMTPKGSASANSKN
ncbi:transposase [Mastigocladopsis repens]|nr:transposase [Mastigocladopsis repens]